MIPTAIIEAVGDQSSCIAQELFPPASAVSHSRGVTEDRNHDTRRRDTRQRRQKSSKARQTQSTGGGIRCVTQNVMAFGKATVSDWFDGFRLTIDTGQPDVVLLQETRAIGDRATHLKEEYARAWGVVDDVDQCISFWPSTPTAAGGVAILLKPNSSLCRVRPLWEKHWSPWFVAICGEMNGVTVTIMNVYGPQGKNERERLFAEIESRPRPNGLILLGGDFNCTLDAELDRSRATRKSHDSVGLHRLLQSWDLVDGVAAIQLAIDSNAAKADFFANHHTFDYGLRDGTFATSRLDRWYLSASSVHQLVDLVVDAPVCRSDHRAVHLHLDTAHQEHQSRQRARKPSAIRYPLPRGTAAIVQDVSEQHIHALMATLSASCGSDTTAIWDAAKSMLRTTCLRVMHQHRQHQTRAYKQRIRRLRKALREASHLASGTPCLDGADISTISRGMGRLSLDPHARVRSLRNAITQLYQARARRRQQTRYSQYAGRGADATRAFFKRISTKFQASTSHGLPPALDGALDPAERLATDWSAITQRAPCQGIDQDTFFSLLPEAALVADPESLVVPFSEAEVCAAIQSCPRGKASGPDGIPNDWYRNHCDDLTPLMTRLFNDWFLNGRLPRSFSRATIFCIPKKTRPQSGLDYRPIALLNTDYKIYSRLLLTRVSKTVPAIVSHTQFGFVAERQVHDAIDVWSALQRLVRDGKAPAAAIAILLDFAKAYDTLDRQFLRKALQRVGYPLRLGQAVDSMHLATTASYLAEGSISREHAVDNGIRQGCPLAPVLFILAVNTLYEAISHDSSIKGIQLPTSERIPIAGFADDTTIFLDDPAEASAVREVLTKFAAASGLQINIGKCSAIKLGSGAWNADDASIVGFPLLPVDRTARLLGIQVSTQVIGSGAWDVVIQQLRARIHLAEMKTTDVQQRVQVIQAVVMPKVLYVARHNWPSTVNVALMQQHVHNYVWFGRFTGEKGLGRAWMSEAASSLSPREGGLGLHTVASELHKLSVTTTARWSQQGHGIRSCVGAVLLSAGHHGHATTPSRASLARPRLHKTLVATGKHAYSNMTTQPRDETETELARPLLQLVGRGTSADKDWHDGWLHCSYHQHHDLLQPLQAHQAALHGAFDFQGLMAARVCGDEILWTGAGDTVTLSDLAGIASSDDRIGDIIEIEWVDVGMIRCKSKKLSFPLAPRPASSFRRLCDLIVYNYPAVLAPHDPEHLLRVVPNSIDSWMLKRSGGSFELLWSPTPMSTIPVAKVHSTKSATHEIQKFLHDNSVYVIDHHWFTAPTTIWRPTPGASFKRRLYNYVNTTATIAGRRETVARTERIEAEDPVIGAALATVRWTDIQRLPGSNSSQRLLLHRIKSGRLSGWDRLHKRRGCPHCPDAGAAGGTVTHIFWHCPQAQLLWRDMRQTWEVHGLWRAEADLASFVEAVFSMTLPSFPPGLWQEADLVRIPFSASEVIQQVHATAQLVWQQQVLTVLRLLWRWRHYFVNDQIAWSNLQARACLAGSLRAATTACSRTSGGSKHNSAVISALQNAIDAAPHIESPPAGCSERYIIFFDGGSRGNPGPGGSGAVIVATDDDLLSSKVIWSASMAYSRPTMTNNQAEYLGLIAGLRAAHQRGLRHVSIVGDSTLVLNQMRLYRPPRNKNLRVLYSTARRLADHVQVDDWRHHLRAHNKMADAAANIAMDTRRSIQTSHSPGRHEHDGILRHLSSDFQHWQTGSITRRLPIDI